MNSNPWSIGSSTVANYETAANGIIENVRLYDRALSAEEIAILYQLEKPKEALTDANFQTAVNLWFMMN